MPFKRRCPTCGSKQWHKEASSGMIACSEGHLLQSYRNESKDAEEVGPHTMRKRTIKSTRQKKDARSKANPQIYHGAKGRFLYFQCLQNLLRLQVSTLVKLWSLPAEFEVVCRDVWALNLCLLSKPIHGEADEAEEDVPEPDSQVDPEESDSFEDDPEMEQLLREDSDESAEDEEISKTRTEPSTRRAKKILLEDGSGSTIAVLVVTCWLLRIPVIYQDFSRVIEAYELPYLDFVRLLPVEMTLHLTKHAKQSLSPHHAPNTLTLHAISSRLAKRLHSGYGIVTPEMNAGPLLWRAVLSYQGNPTVYKLAKRLLQVLSVPLVLHPSIAASAPETMFEKYRYENVPVEVTFAAVIIMVLKLVYGLDGKARAPKNVNDPAHSLPSMGDYMEKLRLSDKGDQTAKFDGRKTVSMGDLDSEGVDEYLEFCEQALLGGDQSPMLDRWFPVRKGKGRPTGPAVDTNRQERRLMATTGTSGGLGEPGTDYSVWNGRDVNGEMPNEYEAVVCRGAEWTGVEEDYICQVVERYEVRLMGWWRRAALASWM